MLLSGIFIYPVKACAGVVLRRAELVQRGLAHDRRYMLIDRAGVFVTQREQPRLCLVQPRLDGDKLVLSAPGAAALVLPLEQEDSDATLVPYRVWDSTGQAVPNAAGSRWFSELLKQDVSLVYMPETEQRAVSPKRARAGDILSFADGYPLLLISEESLADLNGRLALPLEMRRFRPNLVVSGAAPYAEDGFTTLSIGGLGFRGVKRCQRCVVTTIEPTTGVLGKEPLRTLATYRGSEGKVWFGMNLIHDSCGTLALGDEVRS